MRSRQGQGAERRSGEATIKTFSLPAITDGMRALLNGHILLIVLKEELEGKVDERTRFP
ncbi:MAG: hypothetical protein PHW87_10295 [Methanothrix sp.]|nr:hypothetical protein [Methanothrix sp.]